ncbi:hypothetical protein KCP78_19030 [Salmonella enterica subsp. enterica]|nr:hypothetical protein KCP78_19030 [Salmonella enterica subsp. enterica]
MQNEPRQENIDRRAIGGQHSGREAISNARETRNHQKAQWLSGHWRISLQLEPVWVLHRTNDFTVLPRDVSTVTVLKLHRPGQ